MWCENCQADRAAEANAETHQVTCATCGAVLTSQQFGNLDRQMQKARELLDRWSKEPLLEPYSPLPDKHTAHLPDLRDHELSDSDLEPNAANLIDSIADDSNSEFAAGDDQFEKLFNTSHHANYRYDLAHGSDAEDRSLTPRNEHVSTSPPQGQAHAETPQDLAHPSPPQVEAPTEELQQAEHIPELQPSTSVVQPSHRPSDSQVHRTDPPPQQTAPATHLNIQQLIEERLEHKSRKVDWMMMVGQWLAYLGVLAMTAGAAVIVFGYFGGAEGMTPRGWMLTTAGQMLLFLGIVTLISSGMERSSEEITDRIDLIGEQLFRLESEARKHFVKGPKLSPENYAEDADSHEPESVKEDVTDSV